MDIITVDFETYYDKTYTLFKMTTEEYIRSALFETIGVSIKVNDGETIWISGEDDVVKKYLQDNYDWETSALLAHNTMFDGAILNWHYGIRPHVLLDTLCMARALHGVEVGGSLAKLAERYKVGQKGTEVVDAISKRREEFTEEELSAYGDYCVNDTELTYKLFSIFMNGDFPKQELKVIDLTLRMFTDPVLELDTKKLGKHLKRLVKRKNKLLKKCGVPKSILMSNPKFANELRKLGVEPPMKVSLRTGREAYAFAKTDEGFKKLQQHTNPEVRTLVEARIGLKGTLEETRTQRFIEIGSRGLLPVPLKYYAAHTGRWGGYDKTNLHNLPSRGDNAKVLKSCVVAPQGYSLIEADSAQIEARVLAWLAEQADLVKAFAEGKDVYKQMAARIYGIKEKKVTDQQRFIGKTTILGAGYGMGAVKFREQLETYGVSISDEEAATIIRIYRKTYSDISALWRTAQAVLVGLYQGHQYQLGKQDVLRVEPWSVNAIRLPSELLMRYEGLSVVKEDVKDMKDTDKTREPQFEYHTRMGMTKIYGGKVIENVCQAIARCVIAEQMLLVAKKYRIVLTVHDSLAVCVKDEEVQEAATYINECMQFVPEWAEGLPLVGDINIGKTYGGCIEHKLEGGVWGEK